MTVCPPQDVLMKGFEGHATNKACLSADWTPKAEACLRRKYVGRERWVVFVSIGRACRL